MKRSKNFPKPRKYILVNPLQGVQNKSENGLRILSYNVLAQCKARISSFPYCELSVLKWHHRRKEILNDILSQKPNVACLQEVDNYETWWRPQLAAAGYDSVYKKRGRRHKEGVAIFYRREQFQLFGSEEIDFNEVGSYLREEKPSERLEQNNVGLVIRIQPWEESLDPTAICVATAQLVTPEHEDLIEVQRKQLLMLLRKIEVFNSDFQLPVALCGTFNFLPDSDHYCLVTHGMFPKKLLRPSAIKLRPTARAIASSQIELSWQVEPDCGDAPLEGYVVKRRAGGKGTFKEPICFSTNESRSVKICGLSASVTYEFIVAGVSSIGVGEFSPPSIPCKTMKNDFILPVDRHLRHPTEGAVIVAGDNLETHENWVLESEKEGSNIDEHTGSTPRFEDFSPNLAVNPTRLGKSGFRPKGLVHQLNLSSAYYLAGKGKEPLMTKSVQQFQGCVDYIFYSKEKLFLIDALSVPVLEEPKIRKNIRKGTPILDKDTEANNTVIENTQETEAVEHVEEEKYDPELIMKQWEEKETEDENVKCKWLPNKKYASDHFCLCATLGFRSPTMASRWN